MASIQAGRRLGRLTRAAGIVPSLQLEMPIVGTVPLHCRRVILVGYSLVRVPIYDNQSFGDHATWC